MPPGRPENPRACSWKLLKLPHPIHLFSPILFHKIPVHFSLGESLGTAVAIADIKKIEALWEILEWGTVRNRTNFVTYLHKIRRTANPGSSLHLLSPPRHYLQNSKRVRKIKKDKVMGLNLPIPNKPSS